MKKIIISGVMALSALSLQGCYSTSWDSSLDPEYHEKHGLPYYSNEGLPYERTHEADDVGPKAKARIERERIEREKRKSKATMSEEEKEAMRKEEKRKEINEFIENNFSKVKPIGKDEDMANIDTLW